MTEALSDANFIDKARSMTELVDVFVELSHNEEKKCVTCVVCNPPDETSNVGTSQTPRPGVFLLHRGHN